MKTDIYHQSSRSSSSLVLFAFTLSNLFASISLFWLVPVCVFSETALWFLLAAATLSRLQQEKRLPTFFAIAHANRFLFLFIFFAGLSIFWSVDWSISLARLLTLLALLLVGGYIGLRYSLKEILEFLSVFGVYILTISLILIVLAPNIGVMNYHIIQGAWRGLYWHKNHMGFISGFIALVFFMMFLTSYFLKKKIAWVWGSIYLFSLFFVFQTDSVGAYFSLISVHGMVFLILIWLRLKTQIKSHHYIIFITMILFVAGLILSNLEYVLGLFNREISMTGRTLMWWHLFNNYLAAKPLGGYGFNAFWHIENHRVTMQLAAEYPDPIVIADNGFIDILINTGFIGLSLFLLLYLGIWWRSLLFAWKAATITDCFPLIFMFYMLVANISWSLMYENESFFMLLMVIMLFSIGKRSLQVPPTGLSN